MISRSELVFNSHAQPDPNRPTAAAVDFPLKESKPPNVPVIAWPRFPTGQPGQKMPLSATTPYAGSLVEQGGKFYQQASYQDGQAHVYVIEHPDAWWHRRGDLSDAWQPEHGWRHRRDVSVAEHQRSRRGELHDRTVRHTAVRDGPGHGRSVFEPRVHATSANMQLPGLTGA